MNQKTRDIAKAIGIGLLIYALMGGLNYNGFWLVMFIVVSGLIVYARKSDEKRLEGQDKNSSSSN